MLGGKVLADLGAEVIKVEPPKGSSSRIFPFYKDNRDPEKSIFWFAYNTNKRGVTLDLGKPEGQEIFKALVKKVDVVMESFEPGYMGKLGLGYDDLVKIKPNIIFTSVTPFGQNGPKAHYKSSELTIWASGSYLNDCGDPDRAPTWIGFPQAQNFGGAEAAIGTLTALWYLQNTGEGQYVDVSMQECAASPTLNILPMWDLHKVEFKRVGSCLYVPSTGVRLPIYFKCRDGYVMILAQGGNEPFVSASGRLVKWMEEEGMAPVWLTRLNWAIDYNAAILQQELADRVGAEVEKFTMTKTKAELYEEGAIKRQIMIAPVSTTKDIAEDIQLEARDYWVKLLHSGIDEALTYCGPFIRFSESPIKYNRCAPLIGEHNELIYGNELGLSKESLSSLKKQGVI
jgi:benzylsuccinate CoA-transferase BbsE subunit